MPRLDGNKLRRRRQNRDKKHRLGRKPRQYWHLRLGPEANEITRKKKVKTPKKRKGRTVKIMI